tara:strand:- start:1774 stop:2025 length:252 start_codon:yes stop_codon:yes gene_type:complete
MHKSVRVKNVAVAKNTFHCTVNYRRIEDLLQLSNSRQDVVAHVEFVGITPLDFIVDLLIDFGFDAAIKNKNTIADKSANLFVV